MKIAFLALVVTVAGAAPPATAQSVLIWSKATPAEVQARLDQGAEVNARGAYGNTPLHWAAPRNANPAVVALLPHFATMTASCPWIPRPRTRPSRARTCTSG